MPTKTLILAGTLTSGGPTRSQGNLVAEEQRSTHTQMPKPVEFKILLISTHCLKYHVVTSDHAKKEKTRKKRRKSAVLCIKSHDYPYRHCPVIP